MRWTKFAVIAWLILLVAGFVGVKSYEAYLVGSVGQATSAGQSSAGLVTPATAETGVSR